jgi:hypothetical protein
VIEYRSEDEAAAAFESGMSQIADDAGVALELAGRYLIAVWDLEEDRAREVSDRVRAGLKSH